MNQNPIFKLRTNEDVHNVVIKFEGRSLTVPFGVTVAAALLAMNVRNFRTTAVSNKPRGPYCMMGVCFDCLLEIDGLPNRQSCMCLVQDGMSIRLQRGMRTLRTASDHLQGGEE